MEPSVSIILPTFQGEAYLRETLPALRAQEYGGSWEIVAIDSASSDGTVALLHEYGAKVHQIAQADFGHGKTRNQGVQWAEGEIVVFLSQDAVPCGVRWLQGLVDALKDEKVGAIYARQLARPDATPFENHLHQFLYPARSRTFRYRPGRPLPIDKLFFSNVCSAARREICLRFPFDETVIMSEDQFFARDVLLGGYETKYCADVAVVHSHHYNLKSLFKRNFDSGYSLSFLPPGPGYRKAAMALRYLAGQAWQVWRERKYGWFFYLPFYEGTRFVALSLGGRAESLPPKWRKRMSLHRGFWDARD